MTGPAPRLPVLLVGDGVAVPVDDGHEQPYLNLDAAASTSAHPAVAQRVQEFIPWYSSVHRGAGYKSRRATEAYGRREQRPWASPAAPEGDDVAIICRNTTEAINHLAYRLRLDPDDVVVTTVVEHHACPGPACVDAASSNAARTERSTSTTSSPPWTPGRPRPAGGHRHVERDRLVAAARHRHRRRPRPLDPRARRRRPARPHRPLPAAADYVAWSGHKMYLPFGAGVSIGRRATFADGDPFLAGGGAVDLVDLDEVAWTDPPEREAGSPTSSAPSPPRRHRRPRRDWLGCHRRPRRPAGSPAARRTRRHRRCPPPRPRQVNWHGADRHVHR